MSEQLSLGSLIRRQRAALGLTQARLAELVGKAPSTVRGWERDRTRPADPSSLAALVAVLGFTDEEVQAAIGGGAEEAEAEVEPVGVGPVDDALFGPEVGVDEVDAGRVGVGPVDEVVLEAEVGSPDEAPLEPVIGVEEAEAGRVGVGPVDETVPEGEAGLVDQVPVDAEAGLVDEVPVDAEVGVEEVEAGRVDVGPVDEVPLEAEAVGEVEAALVDEVSFEPVIGVDEPELGPDEVSTPDEVPLEAEMGIEPVDAGMTPQPAPETEVGPEELGGEPDIFEMDPPAEVAAQDYDEESGRPTVLAPAPAATQIDSAPEAEGMASAVARRPRMPSYLDDPDEVRTYRVRAIMTAVLLVLMFIVLTWAVGEARDAFSLLFEDGAP